MNMNIISQATLFTVTSLLPKLVHRLILKSTGHITYRQVSKFLLYSDDKTTISALKASAMEQSLLKVYQEL